MNLNPWVIPGSLRNLPAVDGQVPGFRFVFRTPGITFFYVAHRVSLSVDGADYSRNLRLKHRNTTVLATDLPTTDWVCTVGEPIEVIAECPGGLAPGRHRVKLQILFGGGYGGAGDSGRWRTLCEFEDQVRGSWRE